MPVVLFFKQKTAYEMRISDWSSDVCSSDLLRRRDHPADGHDPRAHVPDRAETVRLDGVDARAPAQDEGDPGALQGRQAAPAAGDHAALQEREGQSGRGLPAEDRKSTSMNSSHYCAYRMPSSA